MLVRCTQASEDLTLRVWDASNMKVTQELRGHTDIQARSNSGCFRCAGAVLLRRGRAVSVVGTLHSSLRHADAVRCSASAAAARHDGDRRLYLAHDERQHAPLYLSTQCAWFAMRSKCAEHDSTPGRDGVAISRMNAVESAEQSEYAL